MEILQASTNTPQTSQPRHHAAAHADAASHQVPPPSAMSARVLQPTPAAAHVSCSHQQRRGDRRRLHLVVQPLRAADGCGQLWCVCVAVACEACQGGGPEGQQAALQAAAVQHCSCGDGGPAGEGAGRAGGRVHSAAGCLAGWVVPGMVGSKGGGRGGQWRGGIWQAR